MKESVLVVCPGRGTYNAAELGYFTRHHGADHPLLHSVDAIRAEKGAVPVSALDRAAKFQPSLHLPGDNASALIFACALADFGAIDRERFEIVAVTGNSMGWYLALAAAGVLSLEDGARLVDNMGALMTRSGAGGQIVWPLTDADWRIDPARVALARHLLDEDHAAAGRQVHVSIRLGGMLVFAADDAGLSWLAKQLPKDDPFPMRLNHHAAFHSPLLDHIVPIAQAENPAGVFGLGVLPLIDGTGHVWSPRAFDSGQIWRYTLDDQICRAYDFTSAIQVGVREFAPDRIVILGPGTTLGGAVAQSLIAIGWRGLSGKADFIARQAEEPFVLSMGLEAQRAIACGAAPA